MTVRETPGGGTTVELCIPWMASEAPMLAGIGPTSGQGRPRSRSLPLVENDGRLSGLGITWRSLAHGGSCEIAS